MDLIKDIIKIINEQRENSNPTLKILKIQKEPNLNIDKDKEVLNITNLNKKNIPMDFIRNVKNFEAGSESPLDFEKAEVEAIDNGNFSVKIKGYPQDGSDYYIEFIINDLTLRDATDLKKAILVYYMRRS